MEGQEKQSTQFFQVDKVAVQRLLDAGKILRKVTSQEDIDRIKTKLALFKAGRGKEEASLARGDYDADI